MLEKGAFGESFQWGVSTAAHQIEGAYNTDGKGLSVWDVFAQKKGAIFQNHHAREACDFYQLYKEDLSLMQAMNIKNFRFSLSWPRILPEGIGHINQLGLDFYDRLIDRALELGIAPWITLYHWDLPHALELKGGWTNRAILGWFGDYIETCVRRFGDRVKHWMVLNEPMVFVGAGYFLGIHAPGRKGLRNFLPAVHHASLCQAQGGRIIKSLYPKAEVGTTFSCSHLEPFSNTEKDLQATKKVDALLNRLFIEPALGLGYPSGDLKLLNAIFDFHHAGDAELLPFDFDFIGIQNYTREIIAHSYFVPYLQAKVIKASDRGVMTTCMNWEVYQNSIYHILKKYNDYPQIKNLIVTENGAAFPDTLTNERINDTARTAFLQNHIGQVLLAKKEGVNVNGYFVWTFMDNFEWAEGYKPRFGLVYVDYTTQKRYVKDSGFWYQEFLK